jgi:hypothetical protein
LFKAVRLVSVNNFRWLEQISQTMLADEFSYVQAGHCQIFGIL